MKKWIFVVTLVASVGVAMWFSMYFEYGYMMCAMLVAFLSLWLLLCSISEGVNELKWLEDDCVRCERCHRCGRNEKFPVWQCDYCKEEIRDSKEVVEVDGYHYCLDCYELLYQDDLK